MIGGDGNYGVAFLIFQLRNCSLNRSTKVNYINSFTNKRILIFLGIISFGCGFMCGPIDLCMLYHQKEAIIASNLLQHLNSCYSHLTHSRFIPTRRIIGIIARELSCRPNKA